MQLYQKQKTFSEFFSCISKIYIKPQTFGKNASPSSLMYFPKYRIRKTWLDKCLKRRVSEDPQTDNMENWLKQCSYLNDSTFTKFINTVKAVALEKVSPSDTQNPKTVS